MIRADANRQAEELRGQGDAEKNRILAEAFGQDPDFFAFYRSMQAYETGLKSGDTRLVLSPTSDFFRYFNDPSGARNAGARGAGSAGSRAGTARRRCSISIAALGLALAVEGILFAAFPDGMRRAMSRPPHSPSDRMRIVGIVSAVLGVAIVWAVRHSAETVALWPQSALE